MRKNASVEREHMEILFGIVCTIHKSCASRFRREEEGLVLILFKNYLKKVSWLIPQHWEIRKIFAFTRINNRIFKYNFDHFQTLCIFYCFPTHSFFKEKKWKKRGASSISHHLSSTQWLKIWKIFFYAFNDLTHLWQVKQLFCVWQRAIWTSLCLV